MCWETSAVPQSLDGFIVGAPQLPIQLSIGALTRTVFKIQAPSLLKFWSLQRNGIFFLLSGKIGNWPNNKTENIAKPKSKYHCAWAPDKNCSFQSPRCCWIAAPTASKSGRYFIVLDPGCSKAVKTALEVASTTRSSVLTAILGVGYGLAHLCDKRRKQNYTPQI